MQFSLEWLLSLGSCVIGRPRRCGHGGKRDGAGDFRARMFHDDDNRRPLLRQARVLKRPGLYPARDHQAAMGIGVMPLAFCVSNTAEII